MEAHAHTLCSRSSPFLAVRASLLSPASGKPRAMLSTVQFIPPTASRDRRRDALLSSKLSGRRLFASNASEQAVGVSNFSPLTVLNSKFANYSNERKETISSKKEEASKENPRGATLRGSDVLLALRRAAVQKSPNSNSSSSSSRKGKKKRRPATGSEGGQEEESVDYSNVRPINIRSDWEGRIEELERRIQELQARCHY